MGNAAADMQAGAGTFEGHIVEFDRPSPGNLSQNVRIEVRPKGRAPVSVQLAPGWYLDQQGLHFDVEDSVSVTGSFDPRGESFIARQVRKGKQTVKLRDAQGQPVWGTGAPPP